MKRPAGTTSETVAAILRSGPPPSALGRGGKLYLGLHDGRLAFVEPGRDGYTAFVAADTIDQLVAAYLDRYATRPAPG